MAYPKQITTLHFQYKTAFDVLKSFMSDKTDDELAQMVLDFKAKKDLSKVPKEPKEPKEPNEPKEPKESKEPKEKTKEKPKGKPKEPKH